MFMEYLIIGIIVLLLEISIYWIIKLKKKLKQKEE